jgi:signal peptidase
MIKNPKIKKSISVGINVLLSILIVLILIFTVFAFNSRKNGGIPKLFGKSYLTVLSDSMNTKNEEYDFEGFKRGDMIVIERYTWLQASEKVFKVGDIITFEWKDEENNLVYYTHRIIEINTQEKYYITQGDVANSLGQSTNPTDGHAEKVHFVQVVGSYVSTVRFIGGIFLFFQTPVGFLIFIVLPLLGLFVIEIFNFKKAFVAYRKEKKGDTENPEASTEDLQKEIAKLKEQLAKKQE